MPGSSGLEDSERRRRWVWGWDRGISRKYWLVVHMSHASVCLSFPLLPSVHLAAPSFLSQHVNCLWLLEFLSVFSCPRSTSAIGVASLFCSSDKARVFVTSRSLFVDLIRGKKRAGQATITIVCELYVCDVRLFIARREFQSEGVGWRSLGGHRLLNLSSTMAAKLLFRF